MDMNQGGHFSVHYRELAFNMHCLSTYCALSGVDVGNASSKALLCETHSDALTISFLEILFFLLRGQQKPEEGCPSREFWELGH